MFRKKIKKCTFDRENQRPVIRASICNGEKVAGFKDIHSGRFTEVMFIGDDRDRKEFMEMYNINENEISKEW